MHPSATYFLKDAALLSDGVLRIKTAGGDKDGLWDGYYEVTPSDSDYQYLLWLQKRLRRRWFGPAGVYGHAIDEYREEFRRECA